MEAASLLPPLPAQPDDVAWPTREWTRAEPGAESDHAGLDKEVGALVSGLANGPSGETHALLVVHRGRIVAEGYGGEHNAASPLVSWSMAKSITHALVGILVREGRLDPAAPATVPAWQAAGDPRAAITLENLLRMCDGLDFVEEYSEDGVSHVIDMLFRRGKPDVAAYAAARPLGRPPGTYWSYSSGTSNIVAGILGRTVGGGAGGMLDFMRRELFDPIGMSSAAPRFDDAGTFIASSFVLATARDFARFGLLYLRDGAWDGKRLLPAGWVDHARTPTLPSLGEYGAHWWLARDGSGIFHASGYNGQYIAIDPTRDLVIVRLGASTPDQRGAVLHALARVVRCFPN